MKLIIPKAVAKRFWERVRKSEGCWVWFGYCTRYGYGMFQARAVSHHPLYAHRVSWLLAFGAIPKGLHVLHRCDNPACVRPDHLFLGTQRDNNDDRDRKGRVASGDQNGARTMPHRNPFVRTRGSGLCGEKHPMAKLTALQVRQLRKEFAAGVRRADLAAKYGISEGHVYCIGGGKAWKKRSRK